MVRNHVHMGFRKDFEAMLIPGDWMTSIRSVFKKPFSRQGLNSQVAGHLKKDNYPNP